jgi:hypothetical protein
VVEILETSKHFLEQGKFIILNQKVVQINGLEDIYAKILTIEKFEQILSGKNESDTVNLFKTAPRQQQDFIVQSICEKIVAGQSYDLNLLDRLSRIYCFDENNVKFQPTIQERVEEIIKYKEINRE